MKKLAAVVAGLALAAIVAFPAGAQTSWVRWEGRAFIVWIPTRDWQVVESMSGVDISSPTGLATVSFAYVTNGPAPYDLAAIGRLILSPQAGLTNARILRRGAPHSVGGGGIGQVSEFTAVRTRDRRAVRGILNAQVYNNAALGAFGFAGYLQAAPLRDWAKWSPTLATIQKRIVFLGRG